MDKQVRAYFSGRVQGVGFRFTVERIAVELGIAGWARNMPDGRVEVVGEAEEGVLKEFIARIQQYFSRYIRDTELEWLEPAGTFKDFRIKF